MGHYQGSLNRFIQEEGKEWEETRKEGQTHTLDTMAITDHVDGFEDVDEQSVFRECFLMQAHTMHNKYIQLKTHISETGTPEQIGNFLRVNRPSYENHATRVIMTSEALQESMDTLATLQKELASKSVERETTNTTKSCGNDIQHQVLTIKGRLCRKR